jgi:nitrate/nitrite transporter NarK
MATSAMVTTGLVFHQVSLLSERGVSKEVSLGLLSLQAFFACIMSLVGGFLADRISPRRLLAASMIFMAAAILLLLSGASMAVAIPYTVLLGLHTGIQRCCAATALVGYFGRTHFGSIKGIAMSLVIGAAALGPLPLALAKDHLGRYDLALVGLLIFPLASAVAVWSAIPPGRPRTTSL